MKIRRPGGEVLASKELAYATELGAGNCEFPDGLEGRADPVHASSNSLQDGAPRHRYLIGFEGAAVPSVHQSLLVLATGKVEATAGIMNRHGAVEIEETSGPEPHLPHVVRESMTPIGDSPVLAGRIRQPGGGALLLVW